MANSLASKGSILVGSKTVTAAGTAEALLTTGRTVWPWIKIKAKNGNTGQVYIGGSDVDSNTHEGLDANDEVIFFSRYGFELSDIYIDVDTNDEGVDLYAWVS